MKKRRIERTVKAYHSFLSKVPEKNRVDFKLLIVLNGCIDSTLSIVKKLADELDSICLLDFKEAGKGYALTQGFAYACKQKFDLIGFVDADMATSPQEFFNLITQIDDHDGIIASRYMKGSAVVPPRPFIKRWGSRLIYEPLVRYVLGLRYKDLQCGAKLFKHKVIEAIVDHLTIRQWAFDIELLYLCKKCGFIIKEIPTVWHDQAFSKLNVMGSGMKMLSSVFSFERCINYYINEDFWRRLDLVCSFMFFGSPFFLSCIDPNGFVK